MVPYAFQSKASFYGNFLKMEIAVLYTHCNMEKYKKESLKQ